MELGALVCKPKDPLCDVCPVNKICGAYKVGCQNAIPVKKDRKILNVHAVIALIEDRGKYFIQKRPKGEILADLWEFPGGKIEKNETSEDALHRELREELGVELKSAKRLFEVQQFYTQFKVNLHVWACVPKKFPEISATRRWISQKDFKKYPMPSGTVKIVDKLFQPAK
jgi:A/G-specific adenine glycosylase